MDNWVLYLLRCGDGKLYTGITNDLERRLANHSAGKGAKFTRGRGPLNLAFSKEVGCKSVASKLEWRVKRLRRAQKEQLISGALALDSLLVETS